MFNKKIILVIIISSAFFFIGSVVAVTCPDTVNWDNSTGVCIPMNTGLSGGTGEDPITSVIENVMLWLLRVVGMIAVIAFVISGIQYLTSAGNENQITTAKRNMMWSIVGVIVALIGLIILNFVNDMLGGSYSGGTPAGSGGSATSTGSTSSGASTYINPDTGLPYSDTSTSASRGQDIVNSAINNSATTVPNSPVDQNNNGQDLPIAQEYNVDLTTLPPPGN